MTKKFASQADLEVKKTTFAQLSEHCWAYTAEGDPNTGVIMGEDAVLICDALATPVMAQSLIAEIRKITDKLVEKRLLLAKLITVAHGTSRDAAQHITSPGIFWHDAITNQK